MCGTAEILCVTTLSHADTQMIYRVILTDIISGAFRLRRVLSVIVAIVIFSAVVLLIVVQGINLVDFSTQLAVALIPIGLAILFWGFKPDIEKLLRKDTSLVAKTTVLDWRDDMAGKLDPKFEHVTAYFFYPKTVSWTKGERNPMRNMPRFKAIVNHDTNIAYWMTEYAIDLFRKGKVQHVSVDGSSDEDMKAFFHNKGITLIEKPATESALLEHGTRTLPQATALTEPTSQRKIAVEETTVLDTEEYLSYEFDLTKDEELDGNVSSDEMISFYFLSRYGLSKFENDKEFSYEYGSEGVLKAKINFIPPRAGKWYLVIENEEENRATVTIRLERVAR